MQHPKPRHSPYNPAKCQAAAPCLALNLTPSLLFFIYLFNLQHSFSHLDGVYLCLFLVLHIPSTTASLLLHGEW